MIHRKNEQDCYSRTVYLILATTELNFNFAVVSFWVECYSRHKKPVLKTCYAALTCCFPLLKERVRNDPKRLKNGLQAQCIPGHCFLSSGETTPCRNRTDPSGGVKFLQLRPIFTSLSVNLIPGPAQMFKHVKLDRDGGATHGLRNGRWGF